MTTTHRPTTRSAARLLATGLALATLVGCSSNEPKFDTFPADTSAAATLPPSTQPPTTTAAPVTTTAPAETTQPPIDTTAPPVPATTLEQSALEGFEMLETVGGECVQFPTTCDLTAYAAEGSDSFDRLRALLDQRFADGLVAHRIPELDYWNIESVVAGDDGQTATVTYCLVDGFWLYTSNDTWADLTDDILVDDTLNSWRFEKLLILTERGWRSGGVTTLDEWQGENQCGPKL
jgi:hypothetical protein